MQNKVKQTELDSLYLKYISILSMKETLNKNFKEDEENFVVSIFQTKQLNSTQFFKIFYEHLERHV